jgi:hypothetical protein
MRPAEPLPGLARPYVLIVSDLKIIEELMNTAFVRFGKFMLN